MTITKKDLDNIAVNPVIGVTVGLTAAAVAAVVDLRPGGANFANEAGPGLLVALHAVDGDVLLSAQGDATVAMAGGGDDLYLPQGSVQQCITTGAADGYLAYQRAGAADVDLRCSVVGRYTR